MEDASTQQDKATEGNTDVAQQDPTSPSPAHGTANVSSHSETSDSIDEREPMLKQKEQQQQQSDGEQQQTTSQEPASDHPQPTSQTEVENKDPPERENDRQGQSSNAVKLRNPIPQDTPGLTSQEPRPQSYIVQGSATLPIHGPLRPLSTAISDTPGEQFDTLYDTLPTELRNKKQKKEEIQLRPLPSTIISSTVEEQPETPTEKIALRIDDEQSQEAPVYRGMSADPLSAEHPNNHMILTIVSMVLCGVILNVFAFTCLIPAFFFSRKSKAVSLDGDWDRGTKLAKRTLILNLVAIIGSVIGIFVLFIVLQIVFGATVY